MTFIISSMNSSVRNGASSSVSNNVSSSMSSSVSNSASSSVSNNVSSTVSNCVSSSASSSMSNNVSSSVSNNVACAHTLLHLYPHDLSHCMLQVIPLCNFNPKLSYIRGSALSDV